MKARPNESTDIRVRIGQRIRAARMDAGYSQNELARALSAAGMPTITSDQISRWERGLAMPRPTSFRALERVLGVALC
jgi:transcriptional regulator with XRE-family HTH domain